MQRYKNKLPSRCKGLNKVAKVGGLKVPLDNTHTSTEAGWAQQRTSADIQKDLVPVLKDVRLN